MKTTKKKSVAKPVIPAKITAAKKPVKKAEPVVAVVSPNLLKQYQSYVLG